MTGVSRDPEPSLETTRRHGTAAPRSSESTADEDLLMVSALERLGEMAPLDDLRALTGLLPNPSTSHDRTILVELIKLDLAAAFEQGPGRRIEDYVEAMPSQMPLTEVPYDLVLEEMQLRRERGERFSNSDYARRFPHCEKLLQRVAESINVAPRPRAGDLPAELSEGDRVDDFSIVRELGKGAFARVYLARQISMQRLVALKISHGSGTESQTLAQLDHPNIVRVYDQRILSDRRLHLLYMQYLPGGTLKDVVDVARGHTADQLSGALLLRTVDRNLLRATQQVPERSAVRDWLGTAAWPTVVSWVGIQLSRALDDAHGHGVLHRDVKPANVLLSSECIPKLADFNVSFAEELQRNDTGRGIGGSIAYMSPEHLRAIMPGSVGSTDGVGESADLYSLGVLLWELWQGHRPFPESAPATARGDLVAGQLEARFCEPVVSARIGGGSERVLEETLRRLISPKIEDRPSSGAELAGRLRLALHPETARLFDPGDRSFASMVLRCSPWLIAAAVILLPNIAAGIFNYFYNSVEIIERWSGTAREEIVQGFWGLATAVNLIAYPLGAALMIWFTRPMVAAINAARQRSFISQDSIESMLILGRRAAWIGGMLWGVASLIYPLALSAMYPWFPVDDAIHFFVSLVICGGIAAVYPYFGMTVLSTCVYYPRLLRDSMQDPQFDRRAARVARVSARFLLAAAGIPLLALALLLSVEELARWVMAWAVAATAIGLVAAFQAYLCVQKNWGLMASVLSSRRSPIVPRGHD